MFYITYLNRICILYLYLFEFVSFGVVDKGFVPLFLLFFSEDGSAVKYQSERVKVLETIEKADRAEWERLAKLKAGKETKFTKMADSKIFVVLFYLILFDKLSDQKEKKFTEHILD